MTALAHGYATGTMRRHLRDLSRFGRGLAGLTAGALLLGAVLVVADDGTAEAIGLILVMAGVTLATSLVFLVIGEGEDRYRRRHPRG